jgi:hypothetical protein
VFFCIGGNGRTLSGIDGRDQWPGLLDAEDNSDQYRARQEILVHIDEKEGQKSIVYRNWKLVSG